MVTAIVRYCAKAAHSGTRTAEQQPPFGLFCSSTEVHFRTTFLCRFCDTIIAAQKGYEGVMGSSRGKKTRDPGVNPESGVPKV
jgi:hypothetical protein